MCAAKHPGTLFDPKTTKALLGFVHLCAGKDSNLRRPKPTGLQPVVIDHSTTDACAHYS